jgi:hypothetical protein
LTIFAEHDSALPELKYLETVLSNLMHARKEVYTAAAEVQEYKFHTYTLKPSTALWTGAASTQRQSAA